MHVECARRCRTGTLGRAAQAEMVRTRVRSQDHVCDRRTMRSSIMDSLTQPHNFPGKLIVVEGIDGSGKSTQLQLVKRYLEARGLQPFFTEWNSADLVKALTKKAKKKMALTPMTFSLLH